jgi:hypothetical protein
MHDRQGSISTSQLAEKFMVFSQVSSVKFHRFVPQKLAVLRAMSLCAPWRAPWPLPIRPAPRPPRRGTAVTGVVVVNAVAATARPREARQMMRWLEGLGAKGPRFDGDLSIFG